MIDPSTTNGALCVASFVSYALGRMTYIVEVAQQVLRDNWHELPDGLRQTIRRDIARELADAERRGGYCGMEMDHRAWRETLRWIEEQNDG